LGWLINRVCKFAFKANSSFEGEFFSSQHTHNDVTWTRRRSPASLGETAQT
jgi:hypothetical protein